MLEMPQTKNSNNWLCGFQEVKIVNLLTNDAQRLTEVAYSEQ